MCRGRSCRAWCGGRLYPLNGSPLSVVREALLLPTELEQAFDLLCRYGHHRQPTYPHEPEIGERSVLLNLAKRHRPRQLPFRSEIDHRELGVLLLRIWVRLRHDLGDTHHSLLVPGVVHQHLVSRLHCPQVLQGKIVLDTVPGGRLLPREVVVAVRRWLGLYDPVVHSASVLCAVQPTTASTSSPITSASDRPNRFDTLNE